MKINTIYFVSMILLWSACVNNKLDETQLIDCTTSTIDFTSNTTDADCGQNNGAIEITAAGGEQPYLFSIGSEVSQPIETFDNLIAGNYNITLTDNRSCSVTKNISVAVTSGFQATATVTPSGCNTSNGTITVQATSGIEPYSYMLGKNSQASSTFNNLSSGQFEVEVTDATGCSFSIIKTISTGISYTSSVKPIIANSCAITGCHDGSSAQTNFTIFSNVQNRASSIKSRTQSGSMPKNSSITQEQKDAIACWVDDGAKDN